MKTICTGFLLVAISFNVHSNTYYFGEGAADEGWIKINNSEQISKILFSGGDKLYIECGAVFKAPLILNIKKESNSDLFEVSPRRNDCGKDMPEVSGLKVANLINNENYYTYSVGFDKNKIVAVYDRNKKPLAEARVPESGLMRISGKDAASYYVSDGRAKISVDQLMREFPGVDFTGATIVAKTEDWKVEERKIIEYHQHDGSIVLNSKFHYIPRDGVQFYLKGLPWMLGYSKGWAVERGNDGVWILRISPNLVKGQTAVFFSINESNIKINGSAKISGIKSSFSGDAGILADSEYLNIYGMEFFSSYYDGIRVASSGVVNIKNSLFFNSGRDAIRVLDGYFSGVFGNVISDTGNSGEISDTVAAINVDGARSSHIEGNSIKNSGYSGVRTRYRAYVKNNTITNSCLWLDDCGAIYSWNRTTPDISSNSIIEGNNISGLFGRDDKLRLRTKNRKIAAGIYLDEKTNGFFVIANNFNKVSQGIFMGGSTNNYIYGNKFYNFSDCGVCVYESREKKSEKNFSSIIANGNYFDNSPGVVVSVYGASDALLQPIFLENKSEDGSGRWSNKIGRQLNDGVCRSRSDSKIDCNIYN